LCKRLILYAAYNSEDVSSSLKDHRSEGNMHGMTQSSWFGKTVNRNSRGLALVIDHYQRRRSYTLSGIALAGIFPVNGYYIPAVAVNIFYPSSTEINFI